MDMRHKRLVFSRIQHFSISAAGMSRSQKGSSSLETELLPERYPRLRIVAILPSILSAVVYFATSALSDRRGLKALIRLHGLVQKNFITPGARLILSRLEQTWYITSRWQRTDPVFFQGIRVHDRSEMNPISRSLVVSWSPMN